MVSLAELRIPLTFSATLYVVLFRREHHKPQVSGSLISSVAVEELWKTLHSLLAIKVLIHCIADTTAYEL